MTWDKIYLSLLISLLSYKSNSIAYDYVIKILNSKLE